MNPEIVSSAYSLLIRGKGDCMASRIAVEMLCKQIGIKAVGCTNVDYHGKTLEKIMEDNRIFPIDFN